MHFYKLFCLWSGNLYRIKKNYTQSMDSLLTYVNKAPITTGILYDRVMAFSSLNMPKENGTITKSNFNILLKL